MRVIVGLVLLSPVVAGRWRFATPFPGKVEQSMPESLHKPYDDLADLERVFDTKETSDVKKKVSIKEEDIIKEDEKKKKGFLPTFGI